MADLEKALENSEKKCASMEKGRNEEVGEGACLYYNIVSLNKYTDLVNFVLCNSLSHTNIEERCHDYSLLSAGTKSKSTSEMPIGTLWMAISKVWYRAKI